MTDVQEYCLRWNNHQSNLVSSFYDLRLGEDFVDVTLACEGQSVQAHKVSSLTCKSSWLVLNYFPLPRLSSQHVVLSFVIF